MSESEDLDQPAGNLARQGADGFVSFGDEEEEEQKEPTGGRRLKKKRELKKKLKPGTFGKALAEAAAWHGGSELPTPREGTALCLNTHGGFLALIQTPWA